MRPKTVHILLIEDDAEQAASLLDLLTELKDGVAIFELDTADRLASAIQKLTQNSYDVILLDLNLPDSRGIETFVKLSSKAIKLPIIPLTGSGDERLALEVMSLGAQDYLVKGSFGAGVLKRAILYALERKRLMGQLEDLINKNADGMVVVDSEGLVRQINPTAEKILGVKADQLVGKQFDFPVFPDQVTELKFPTPDGQEKIAEMRTTEIEWQGKSACLASIRDITELKRLEQLKAEVKEHRRIDKLKDDFVASISSELRAPLTVISGAIHNLLSGANGMLNEMQTKTTEIARRGTDRLIKAITNILDISRLESGKLELHRGPVKIETLFQKSLDYLGAHIKERGITVEMQITPGLPPIDADEELIAQALAHLVDNAVRFARSKVLLRAQSVEGALPACGQTVKRSAGLGVTLVTPRKGIQISVLDDGTGISKEHLGSLFKKFSRIERETPNGSQGVGLGLAICKQIIQNHQGRIWVESVDTLLDQGTQFHFILPQHSGLSSGRPQEPAQSLPEEQTDIS